MNQSDPAGPVAPFPPTLAELDVCYVDTIGRRTGRLHRIEIWFALHEGTMYLISGNGPGADWYRNLIANPDVAVDLGPERRIGTARPVDAPDERRLVGDLLGAKHAGWGGDPDIGLTFEAWCYGVPAIAIDRWRRPSE